MRVSSQKCLKSRARQPVCGAGASRLQALSLQAAASCACRNPAFSARQARTPAGATSDHTPPVLHSFKHRIVQASLLREQSMYRDKRVERAARHAENNTARQNMAGRRQTHRSG
jgi:hypothetical protein